LKRIDKFNSIWKENWLTGIRLIPKLAKWGQSEKGIVLDLGCGESPFRYLFPLAKYYIRIDRNAVDEKVVIADITRIPLNDESVDAVLLFQVLGDIPEPKSFLKEVSRILKPEGRMIIFESMCYPEHDMPHDYYRLMPSGIDYLSMKVGFQCTEITRLGGLFTRFAMLWNKFIMGKIKNFPVICWLAHIGIFLANIICYSLDQVFLHPNLAENYIARFVKRT